jgi:hypothetical protein
MCCVYYFACVPSKSQQSFLYATTLGLGKNYHQPRVDIFEVQWVGSWSHMQDNTIRVLGEYAKFRIQEFMFMLL